MPPTRESAVALATRLRELREGGPQGRVTQQQLAEALGVSPPLISSWEKGSNPAVPSPRHISGYAKFFATAESDRRELEHQLLELRNRAADAAPESPTGMVNLPPSEGIFYFEDTAPVMIVCGTLPPDVRASEYYSDPNSPDYVKLYNYGDVDSLVEIQGHIRAANPMGDVRFLRVLKDGAAEADQLTTHLVLLGGVDWNPLVRAVLHSLRVPITQGGRVAEEEVGAFTIDRPDGSRSTHEPILAPRVGAAGSTGQILIEDVALFLRGPNPWNRKRTVTVFTGMYGRGTYGSVRALTDVRFRDRNTQHLRERFGGAAAYGILSRIEVLGGEVLTPDWTDPDSILYEWPEVGQ